ncbi:hypothetical protein ASPFODRAFT_564932 [Aspergillus luchuensis CBS 106.47]|uniref:Uncharacterized protein n=1 Tax=Aspergillus luchuensis (strain CBS 106.47) TaxID=1137211 RepID=A0A1M3TKG4_ASPLC|nr:hypothetical protein ASPFODRAFT_564932 [Aspergillus luchuensis CBS 106.47]
MLNWLAFGTAIIIIALLARLYLPVLQYLLRQNHALSYLLLSLACYHFCSSPRHRHECYFSAVSAMHQQAAYMLSDLTKALFPSPAAVIGKRLLFLP